LKFAAHLDSSLVVVVVPVASAMIY